MISKEGKTAMMHTNRSDNSHIPSGQTDADVSVAAASRTPGVPEHREAGTSSTITSQGKTPIPASPWRRAMVASSVLFAISSFTLIVTPPIVMGTSIRNQALTSAVSPYGLTATSGSASGGWLLPVSFQDVEVRDSQGQITCRMGELRSTKGLLSYFTDGGDLGELTFVQPEVEIHVGDDGTWPVYSSVIPSNSRCEFRIEDGKFLMTVPWRDIPIVELENLNIQGRVQPDAAGERFLTIDPCALLEKQPLSEEHAKQNLALIAPILSQSTRIRGTASVWMDEYRISLDSTKGPVSPFPIRGRAEFHSLEAELREEWAKQIVQLTGQVAKTSLPNQITVAQDTAVIFEVKESGIFHEGMVFLLPEIASDLRAESRGTIGLDESLDLTLDVKIPEIVAQKNPLLSMLEQIVREPIAVRVLGTVSQPRLALPPGLDVLSELSRRVAPESHTEEPAPLPNAIFDLIQSGSQSDKEEVRKDLPGSILGLIRSISEEKKKSPKNK
ncbi:MAG: hypothetical protein JNL58_07195 [Planctomyces sp.]|nr:hypothetical protein [Planctomyces sp.]